MANLTAAGDEFAPPKLEREAVAALNKNSAARVIVDENYRVVTVQLQPSATNDTLKHLAACEKLTTLLISSPQIDDEGVNQLQTLSGLSALTISSSGISQSGVDALIKGMPNCRVFAANARGFRPAPGGGPGAAPGGFPAGGLGGFSSSSRIVRPAMLARIAAVQEDLQLTEEQKRGVSEASSQAMQGILEAIDSKVLAALNEEQKARLKQIELQQLGVTGLTRAEVVKQLKLTDEQQTAVEKQIADTSDMDREKKALALLTYEQRKAWEGMLGPKGPVVSNTSRFGGPGGGPPDVPTTVRTVFDRYDTDKDGKLSDAEFPASNRTRQRLADEGYKLTFPVPREEFEKTFGKSLEASRGR
jgi:hypothetical protein